MLKYKEELNMVIAFKKSTVYWKESYFSKEVILKAIKKFKYRAKIM